MSVCIVVITYTLVSAKPAPEKKNVEVMSVNPEGTVGSPPLQKKKQKKNPAYLPMA